MKSIFDDISQEISQLTTKRYSTSFSLGISLLNKKIQKPIYAIYGFVRFADEIVDSFHGFDKEFLLADFKTQTYRAIEEKISLNPILNSFQWAVNTYNIPLDLIETFLNSMEMDLNSTDYEQVEYETYILGSAEVVGLMCLQVFVEGDTAEFERLKHNAMKLGSAFQKINFLRDLQADYNELGRAYFPGFDIYTFDDATKKEIEKDISLDFSLGYEGIIQLPKKARLGVYLAYVYYFKLFNKIKNSSPETLMNKRIRIPNNKKFRLLLSSYVRHNLNSL